MENWVKTIASYMIFCVFFIQILPSGKFEKYIRVFLGMLFLLIIFSPLMELLSMNQSLWWHFEEQLYMVDAEEDSKEFVEAFAYSKVADAYEKELEQQFICYVHDYGATEITAVSVHCCETRGEEFGQIQSISFYINQNREYIKIPPIVIGPSDQVMQQIPEQYKEMIRDFMTYFSLNAETKIEIVG